MVIVLMGPDGHESGGTGAVLAGRLGWIYVDADAPHTAGDLQSIVANAAGRRDRLVLVCEQLTMRQRTVVAGDLRAVRFVSFGTPLEAGADIALVLNDAADVDINIGRIRLEFGV
jgi:hypothetical protein